MSSDSRDENIDYAEFGRLFFEHAVSAERIGQFFGRISGREIDFGPRQVGPAGLARVEGHGEVGEVALEFREDTLIRYRATIPIDITLEVQLAGRKHAFDAHIEAGLTLLAHALRPLRLFVEVLPPQAEDVHIDVRAQGLGASMLNSLADIEGEIRRYVAQYIQHEIEKPEIREARDLDIAQRIDKSWSA